MPLQEGAVVEAEAEADDEYEHEGVWSLLTLEVVQILRANIKRADVCAQAEFLPSF